MELEHAQFVLGLCREFHCLPSQLMEEDISFLQMIKVEQLGTPDEPSDRDPGTDEEVN